MAQLRYECSHCTKLSCNHTAATQHNRDAHGGQANILPERSKAQMRVNDFAQRAEIARLRADLANAGAVMVEACAREADAHYAAGDMGNPGHHIRALSTLSPVAAAAGVLQVNTPNPVFDLLKPVLMGEVSEAVTYLDADGNEYSDRRMVSWDAMKDVLRLAFRALAEQEKSE